MTHMPNNAVHFILFNCFCRFDVSSPIVSSSLSPVPSDGKLDPPITIIAMNDKARLLPTVNFVVFSQRIELQVLFLIGIQVLSNREKYVIFSLKKHVVENFKLKLNILCVTTKS